MGCNNCSNCSSTVKGPEDAASAGLTGVVGLAAEVCVQLLAGKAPAMTVALQFAIVSYEMA